MIILMTAVASEAAGAGGSRFGGIPVVNRLLMETLIDRAGARTAISLWDDPGDTSWSHGWPCAGAGGSKRRLLRLVLQHRAAARGDWILVTHLNLVPLARLMIGFDRFFGGGFGGAPTRCAVVLHGVEAWRPLRAREVWGLRGCDRIVTFSDWTLRNFWDHNPRLRDIPSTTRHLPARRLTATAPGIVEPSAMSGVAEKTNDGELRVTIVGRLWGRGLLKGQRQLLKIWPQLLARFPRARLWIVGGGAGQTEFSALAAELGVAETVVFPGEVDDATLSQIYADTDVYAMPSVGEGFGLVFAEAMSAGIPCICSRYDGGREVVDDGVTGFHVDPDQPEELLSALVRLLENPDLRRQFGAAGQERVERHFSLASFQHGIRELFAPDAS